MNYFDSHLKKLHYSLLIAMTWLMSCNSSKTCATDYVFSRGAAIPELGIASKLCQIAIISLGAANYLYI